MEIRQYDIQDGWSAVNTVPNITSNDTGKVLTANYNSGNPISTWQSLGGITLIDEFDVTPTSTTTETVVWTPPSPTTTLALYLIVAVYSGKTGTSSSDVVFLSTTATSGGSGGSASNPTLTHSLFQNSSSMSAANFLKLKSAGVYITGLTNRCLGKVYKLV